jgi:predicted ATPase
LCGLVGETPQLFPVLWGLWTLYLTRGDCHIARDLGEQLLRLARNTQDPALLLEAHVAFGMTLVSFGELTAARAHLEQGITLYDPQQYASHAFSYGQDPGAVCLSWVALVLWLLGYPEQALKRTHEALALARELTHPLSLAYALSIATVSHQHRREGQVALERAEETISLSLEQGFAFWLAGCTVLKGWSLAEQGQAAEGLGQLYQGLIAWQATGAGLFRSYGCALLAEVHEKVGQTAEGLDVLTTALTLAENNGERWEEAELYRLKGKLTLQQQPKVQSLKSKVSEKSRVGTAHHDGTVAEAARVGRAHPTGEEEAEACFLKAIEIARRQSAKSWELRTVMSLSRLWQQQGKKKEAHEMLAEIYGWFTEGFDTKDLQEAKALLEELG